jgi:hypothetical protein
MVDGALVDTCTRAYKIVIARDDIGETLGGKKREPDSQLRLTLKLKLPSRSLHTPTIALMICILFTSRGNSSEEEEQAPK